MTQILRAATDQDWPAIWAILKPVFRAGTTYAVDPLISEDEAYRMWLTTPKATFVVSEGGTLLGTYYIKTNHQGGGAHICNCGYVTADAAQGRGIATQMCEHSLHIAPTLGYRAMQFNFVLASNVGAVRLWQKLGFAIQGTLPDAFDHPELGYVDAHIMWKSLI